MTRESKSKILKAYLDGTITKEEMIFLFEVGIIVPPIPWIYPTDDHQKKHQAKRDLVERIFDYNFPKIEWI